jgi:hypothetical protein
MCPENVPKRACFWMFRICPVYNISHLEDDQQVIIVIIINYPSFKLITL